MSLDLKKLIHQIKNVEAKEPWDIKQKRLEATYRTFQTACEKQNYLIRKLTEAQYTQKATFYFATPFLDKKGNLSLDTMTNWEPGFSTPHIVVATDGSQINPSAHEFISASLVNIGLVSLPYFDKSLPVFLSSEPVCYGSLEEVNPKVSSGDIPEEDLIAYERTLKEIEGLVKLSREYVKYKVPVIALLDGTIVHWHIEKFSNLFIEHFINRFSNAMLELKDLKIPVASFLSNSRSNDLINMLRIFKCPYEEVDCKKHCSQLESKSLPCNPCPDYKPVFDRKLIEKYFGFANTNVGTRTILFKSNNKILNYYPDDLKVYFFYVYTGTEVARVELPAYVAESESLFNLLHNVVSLQCKVGFGYPVSLSEAHLQAVINRQDREIFYDLLREHILKEVKQPVKLSAKELKKRISFV